MSGWLMELVSWGLMLLVKWYSFQERQPALEESIYLVRWSFNFSSLVFYNYSPLLVVTSLRDGRLIFTSCLFFCFLFSDSPSGSLSKITSHFLYHWSLLLYLCCQISVLAPNEIEKIQLPPNTGAVRDLCILPGSLTLIASIGKKLSLFRFPWLIYCPLV